jgi:hypothetical protein
LGKNILASPILGAYYLDMSVSDWIGILVGIGTLYFLWAQNQIFKRQNAIFAQQAGVAAMPAERSISYVVKRYWPMLAMALLALLTWAGTAYVTYERHRSISSKYDDLITNDESHIESLIQVLDISRNGAPHFDAIEPYVDFNVYAVSSTVLPITVKGFDGRLQYKGRNFGWTARQFLSHDSAVVIAKDRTTELNAGHVDCVFSYVDSHGQPKNVKIGVGNRVIRLP